MGTLSYRRFSNVYIVVSTLNHSLFFLLKVWKKLTMSDLVGWTPQKVSPVPIQAYYGGVIPAFCSLNRLWRFSDGYL